MRKDLQTRAANSLAFSLQKIAVMFSTAFVLLLTNSQLAAQVDCNTTMACNDGIQISLDTDCEAIITPDMIIEDPQYGNAFYEVEVMDIDGSIIPNATVDYDQVNQTLDVSVNLLGCAASCWGTITIEDKLPPNIFNCDVVEVDCGDNIDPGAIISPFAVDACSSTSSEYSDTEVTNQCADDFGKTITRAWIFTDQQGNSDSCFQLIQVRRATIATISFPPNYDDIDEDAFSCDVLLELLPNGAPSPNETGRPFGSECPNIQIYFSDIIFDICGASKKILRQWTVVDWCTGEEVFHNQIIKILDTAPPICTAVPDFVHSIVTEDGECTATWNVPPPIVVFECSEYNYSVSYKLRDENGDPFTNSITDNVFSNGDGTFRIEGLPQDTTWIVYTITDVCGNEVQCFTEVYVEDDEAPTPVCEGFTVVGLEDEGWADIFATSIDDGSFDNCEVDRFEVRRQTTSCGFPSDLQFGEKVNFCCEDVTAGYITVEMRVYDKSGNFNDCIVNVNVQDKIAPTISCPINRTIQCGQDPYDLGLTGDAVAFDNCEAEITRRNTENLNDCGLGTVVRTFTATDPQGREASCVQVISIVDSNPFGANNISWPQNRDIIGCTSTDITPEALNSFPILSNTDCSNLAISYDDDVFVVDEEYCYKVLRHWRIIDWCNVDPQNPVYYSYTQKIGILNNIPPVITDGCEDMEILSNDSDCEETVTLSITAEDDCTAALQLEYTYTIDLDSDGSIDYTGFGNQFTRTLDGGTHEVRWTVMDACDNIAECSQDITIRNTKAPTPICIGEVVWVLDHEGNAEVWANDFDLKSEDNCDGFDLDFYFDAAGTQDVMFFDCADVPNGIAASIPIQMYVFDQDGNSEFCDVTLVLQDSQVTDACEDTDEDGGRIAGNIIDENFDGLENIDVELRNMDNQATVMDMSENTGEYNFSNVSFYEGYSVAPKYNDFHSNGVSTLDLVKIQRHILGLETFDSPYKIIAADANNSGNLSATDLISIRKVILGVNTEFPNNTSWRFIPRDYEFEDVNDPFGFNEKVVIPEMYMNDEAVDFIAVKVGDINGSAVANITGKDETTTRSAQALLSIDNQTYTAGQTVTIAIKANEVEEAMGMQFALAYDAVNLSYIGIEAGVASISNDFVHVNGNAINISWTNPQGQSFENDEVLFTLTFEARNAGELVKDLSMAEKGLTPEYYPTTGETGKLSIEVSNRNIVSNPDHFALAQNHPNPFSTHTNVTFTLPTDAKVLFTVFTLDGKQVFNMNKAFSAGENTITLDRNDLNASAGILYYRLETEGFSDTKQMIVVE